MTTELLPQGGTQQKLDNDKKSYYLLTVNSVVSGILVSK
jgi:hypothetical protein